MSFFILYCILLKNDSLLRILRFPGYFETPLFRTFFHFPWDFQIAGSTVFQWSFQFFTSSLCGRSGEFVLFWSIMVGLWRRLTLKKASGSNPLPFPGLPLQVNTDRSSKAIQCYIEVNGVTWGYRMSTLEMCGLHLFHYIISTEDKVKRKPQVSRRNATIYKSAQ